MEGTKGAMIPPTLQDMEQTPNPAFLKHIQEGKVTHMTCADLQEAALQAAHLMTVG